VQSAGAMFKAYGEFVRNTGNHRGFRFDRLDQEILELPDAYSTRNGGGLLARRRSEVVGCIAYRAVPTSPNPRTCEIKRLFVLPEQRARGIGSSLVSACIDRARARGYQLAVRLSGSWVGDRSTRRVFPGQRSRVQMIPQSRIVPCGGTFHSHNTTHL
jgi:GNAT superfamily N-acetyltransferase